MTEIGGVVETGGGGEGEGGEGGGAGGGNGLMDAFKEFTTDVTSRFERLEGALKPAETEGEPEVDELDWRAILGLEPEEDEDGDGGEEKGAGPEQISLDMDQLVTLMKGVAAEAVGPVQQERARERRAEEADALEQKYTKLQDPAFAQAIVAETKNLAQTIATAVGQPQMAALLAREPQLAEVVYLAAEAAGAGRDEIPAGQTQGVQLERGGGAAPGDDAAGEDKRGDAIVNAGRARQFRMAQR